MWHFWHFSFAATQSGSRCVQVQRLPRETKVNVSKYHPCHAKCHACHAKCSYMSPSATPATQKTAAPTATLENQARRRSQPDAIRATACHAKWKSMDPSTTPATWNEGGCLKVPRLPRKVQLLPRKVQLHVPKCHACHAHGDTWEPSASPEPARCHTCHACHSKWKSICPSTTPATWNESGCLKVPRLPRKVPRLPRKVQLHVAKCHACHAKSRGAHGDTYRNQARRRSQPNAIAIRATPATQSGSRCVQVPRLPRATKVDVSACHACHANSRGQVVRGWQLKVPRLPRKVQLLPRKVREPSAPPEPARCHTCHACHAKCCYMSPSATPATHLCLSKLCVSKLCVDKLCVSE